VGVRLNEAERCLDVAAILKQSFVGEAEMAVLSDNDVIEEADADDLAGLDKPRRDRAIFRTGSNVTGWVIVNVELSGLQR
jgi:hypothetical protein